MSTGDWLNIALTMAGVFGALRLGRYIKGRYPLPQVRLWPLYLIYNGIWGILLWLDRAGTLPLPTIVGPIALVGGNALLVSLFGLPILPRLRQPQKSSQVAQDPSRVKIIPERKKKRHKRRS